MWNFFESKGEHVITYEKHGYQNIKETTSHPWKLKHIWKHVMETKLESDLHELNPQAKNYPRDQWKWISKDLSEAF